MIRFDMNAFAVLATVALAIFAPSPRAWASLNIGLSGASVSVYQSSGDGDVTDTLSHPIFPFAGSLSAVSGATSAEVQYNLSATEQSATIAFDFAQFLLDDGHFSHSLHSGSFFMNPVQDVLVEMSGDATFHLPTQLIDVAVRFTIWRYENFDGQVIASGGCGGQTDFIPPLNTMCDFEDTLVLPAGHTYLVSWDSGMWSNGSGGATPNTFNGSAMMMLNAVPSPSSGAIGLMLAAGLMRRRRRG